MEEAEALRAVKKFYRSNVNLKAVLYDDGKNFSEKATTLVLFGGTVGKLSEQDREQSITIRLHQH